MNTLRCRVRLLSLALPIALISVSGCGSPNAAISPRTLISVSITPSNPSIAINASEPFIATGNYSDGTTTNLSTLATWASSNQAGCHSK